MTTSKMELTAEGFKEVAGPLGGLSVEYLIKASTVLPAYRAALCRDLSPTTFTVSKTFREIEYFYKKIKSKYPKTKCTFCVHDSLFSEDKDERLKVANEFLQFVSQDTTLSESQLLFNFLGYEPAKVVYVQQTKQSYKTEEEPDIFDDFLASKQKPGPTKPTKTSENIFAVESDNDDDGADLFQDFKPQSGQGRGVLFHDNPSKSSRNQPLLFDQPDLSGALQKHEAKYLIPPEAIVEDEASSAYNEIEDISALLNIDDSLPDFFGEIQHKSRSVPSSTVDRSASTPSSSSTSSSSSSKPTPKPKPSLPPKPVPGSSSAPAAGQRLPTPNPRSQVAGTTAGGAAPPVASRPVPPPRTTVPAKTISPSNSSPALTAPPDLNRKSSKTQAAVADLSEVDILGYIRSEQDAKDDALDLFD